MLAADRSPTAVAVPAFPDVAVPTFTAVAASSLPSSSSSVSFSPGDHTPPVLHLHASVPASAADPAFIGLVEAVTVAMTSTNPTTTSLLPTAPTATGSPAGPTKPTECSLLGSFAIFVQLALGALALLSLVYKRWRERPQRPVKIWFFDASKQVFGSVLVHGANVFMSLLTSGKFSIEVDAGAVAASGVVRRMVGGLMGRAEEDVYVPNPCSFYLLNLGIDVSIFYFFDLAPALNGD